MSVYRAYIVEKKADNLFHRRIADRNTEDLPDNDVLIHVRFSSLNYKDALSATGHPGVTKSYPHTPGIDAAGVVIEDRSDVFEAGRNVLVTGYDLGMNTDGGFGQYIRVPAGWVVPLPEGMTLQESMTYGTAGLTAAIGVDRLRNEGLLNGESEILVTGATGGVGSITVALLSKLGCRVTAATGKMHEQKLLKFLGACQIISRSDVDDSSQRPLLTARWDGVVDTVGGNILSTAIRSTREGGVVACCGNVLDYRFDCNVYPFILRGVTLAGIESAYFAMEKRRILWQKLAGDWKLPRIASITRTVALSKLDEEIGKILKGQQVGRVVIDLSA